MFKWKDTYKSYINLTNRVDRFIHMENELARVGISAKRFIAIKTSDKHWDHYKTMVMMNRTPGAIGCHYSQVAVMQAALDQGKSAFVMEDDLIFCDDIKERLDYIESFVNKQPYWDVIFLGGTVHINPPWWHKEGHSSDLPDCRCTYGKDAVRTSDPRMIRTFGAFSTHAYIVNVKSIKKILKYFEANVHLSMGIDWLFIKMQPQLFAYMFMPGCIIQMDNQSDIGTGITKFSGFAFLGAHWFQKRMEDFNPDTYEWGEASK